jgi:glutamine synthetase
MILNTIVAEAMDAISDQMEKFSAKTFNADLQALLKKEISAHQRVIFNGDGYKPEWIKEATKRGLPNLPSTPEAIKPLLDKENQKLFEKYGVLTKAELESRYEVFREDYERRLEIEARIALEIAKNMIRPVVIKEYLTMQDAKGCAAIDSVKKEMGDELDELTVAIDSLQQALAEGHGIIPAMLFLRHKVDALEAITDDNVWPLPKYREMLFIC